MQYDDQLYRSKVDRWLVVVVAAGLVWAWLAPVRRSRAGRAIDALDFILPAISTAFVVWIFRSTYYVITADTLIVRAGPIRRKVPLHEVRRLRATHNPLSSPALSLDRIEVTYGSKRILISPEDRSGFVRAIVERVPGVTVQGFEGGRRSG
jgi:hypothetical protein